VTACDNSGPRVYEPESKRDGCCLCRCRKGKKVYCSKAKVSCKKPTAKKPTYKKATAKKVEDHPHPEDHHGAGHTRKLQSADKEIEFEVRRSSAQDALHYCTTVKFPNQCLLHSKLLQ
jgi:hypothetical protein